MAGVRYGLSFDDGNDGGVAGQDTSKVIIETSNAVTHSFIYFLINFPNQMKEANQF